VYDRLGLPKDALRDAKQVIALAPRRWHGYARSARILLKAGKSHSALLMVDLALDRVATSDTRRRADLTRLKEVALCSCNGNADNKELQDPFLRIPVEILAMIFEHVVFRDPAMVITLSSICSQWRAISLNTLSLWGTLVLSSKHPSRKARIWIERSNGRIRELVVRSGLARDLEWSFSQLKGMSWDVLRVCRLEVHPFFPQLRKDLLSGMLCGLDDLQISLHSGIVKVNQFLESFTDSSLLTLTLWNVVLEGSVLTSRFTKLTSLVVSPANPCKADDILDVIEANPRLQNLVLDFRQPVIPSSPRLVSTPFIELTHLAISGLVRMSDIFDNLIFPSLRSLHLVHSLSTDSAFAHLVPSVLVELRLRACVVNPALLIGFLRSAPLLQTLELTRLDITPLVAEALVVTLRPADSHIDGSASRPTHSDVPICPSLLHLDFSHSNNLQAGVLVRLVKSRLTSMAGPSPVSNADQVEEIAKPPVAQIVSLRIDGCPRIDAEALPWLRKVVDAVSCVYINNKDKVAKRRR
jgi:F-box/TPR repeat protein Pof3